MARVWMQDSVSPAASYEDRPGRWVAEEQWPSPRIEERSYVLIGHHLEEGPAREPEREVPVQSPLSVGMFAGKWASYAAVPDLPFDQREEDGGALFYESAPLEEDLEVFGLPECRFEVSADRPVAMLAVRLSDVGPSGEATRVTYGILNLTHRDGSEDPQPLEPGQKYRVTIPLNGIAQSSRQDTACGCPSPPRTGPSYGPHPRLPPSPSPPAAASCSCRCVRAGRRMPSSGPSGSRRLHSRWRSPRRTPASTTGGSPVTWRRTCPCWRSPTTKAPS